MSISKQHIRELVKNTLNEQVNRPRHVYQIADEIRKTWKNVNYAAKPYLDAMSQISSVAENFGAEDGRSIVLYFLANASSWRGPDAKRLKDELKASLKGI